MVIRLIQHAFLRRIAQKKPENYLFKWKQVFKID